MNEQCEFIATEYYGGGSRRLDLSDCLPVAAGSFAAIFRAGDEGQYAIKSYFIKAGYDKKAHDEYGLLARLNNMGCTAVPQVYCYGKFIDSEGEHPAFVMQFVDGKTLTNAIIDGIFSGDAKRPYLSGVDAARVALQVARSLVPINEACGIVQRDLSPNNILLTNRCLKDVHEGNLEVYIIDFGQGTLTSRVTITSIPRLATIPYSSPEIFGGQYYSKRNSEKCDVWSLGALIVTMMTGEYFPSEIEEFRSRLPETRDELERIARAKRLPLDLVARLTEMGGKVGDLEEGLADIVCSCTNNNPFYRPPLKAVIEHLEDLLFKHGEHRLNGDTPRYDEEDGDAKRGDDNKQDDGDGKREGDGDGKREGDGDGKRQGNKRSRRKRRRVPLKVVLVAAAGLIAVVAALVLFHKGTAIAVSTGDDYVVTLNQDGTVVAAGENSEGQCDVSGWKGVKAISAGDHHTVALNEDGTVSATGRNDDGECDVSAWRGVAEVSAGSRHTVARREDGSVVATGFNSDGRCDVYGWEGIEEVCRELPHCSSSS